MRNGILRSEEELSDECGSANREKPGTAEGYKIMTL
jgi:hypothetical protein